MYFILNKQSTIRKANKIDLYCLLLYVHGAPCLFMPDSPNRVRGLNDLFLGALISKVGLMCGCQGSLTFSVVEEHSELPFNEIMPRGPGILSVRDA